MKLIGVHLSPFVRKACVALHLKGLDYEHESLVPGSVTPEFRQISPLGKIPALIDGDFTLADSSVICEYLEEKYPEPPIMPQGAEQRARARYLEEYADSKLVEVSSVIFIENFVNPNMFGKETDAERVAQVEQELLPPYLDYLDSQVPPEGYLFGHFCTADISLASPIFTAAYGGFIVDPDRWPRYAAFIDRVAEHPIVAKVREIEAKAVSKLTGGG